jgi:hypothetical protein
MSPAKHLRVLAVLAVAWGAVVLFTGVGMVWAQTSDATPPPPAPPATGAPVPPGAVPGPAQPQSPDPGHGGKSPCDNKWVGMVCGAVDAAKQFAAGDVVGAAGTAVGSVAAPVASAAGQAIQEGFAESISHWVGDGATFFMGKAGAVIDSTTTPQLSAGWFQEHYRPMLALAGLLVIPFIFMSVIGAVIHNDSGRLVRLLAGNLPAATLLAGAGVALVTVGLAVTDELSGMVGHGAGANAGAALARAVAALRMIDGTGGLFALFVGGLMLIVGTVAVWFELLLRSAAIYVAVLFLPIALAGLVWPATSHWARRLVHLLVAVIFAKVVIVAILALAASGLAADTSSDGYAPVMAGAALFGLAAVSPLVLLKLVPVLEAGAVSQAALGRNPSPTRSARAAYDGATSLFDGVQRRLARERSGAPNPMASLSRAPYKPRPANGDTPTVGGSQAPTGTARAGGAGAEAGLAVGQAGIGRARRSADGLGRISEPKGRNGSTGPAGRAPSGGPPPPPAAPERRGDDRDGNGGISGDNGN